MKKLFSACILIAVLFTMGCSKKTEENVDTINVSVEILCDEILDNYDDLDPSLQDEEYVPSDGIILENVTISVENGASALDILKQISEEYDIQIDVSDGYAKAINYIYEKSCGESSGWVYEVNHEMIMEEYFAKDGDIITWKYICDFSNFGM